jgi:hypothetical protein
MNQQQIEVGAAEILAGVRAMREYIDMDGGNAVIWSPYGLGAVVEAFYVLRAGVIPQTMRHMNHPLVQALGSVDRLS